MVDKQEKRKVIEEFGQGPKDTGSTEVQIALLTKEIVDLTGHCQVNSHDYSSKRGLLKKVCQRRKLLRYLEQKNDVKYKELIQKLGLRK